MSDVVSKFIEAFHRLEGTTIGEKKQKLSSLLQLHDDILKNDDDNLISLINNLKPTTYLQHHLFITILIHFKRYSELLTIFQQENELFINKLWKQKWIFERLLQESSTDYIINEMFQNLSYVTRMRFLKNLMYYTKNEEKIDEFYNLLLLKYDSKTAHVVLAGCTLKKIEEALSNFPYKFTNNQVLFLHKKSYLPHLIEMEKAEKVFDFYDYHSKTLGAIAGSDFEFFFTLFSSNKCCNIGKHLTRKLIRHKKEFLLQNSADIHKMLHKRPLVKELKGDFKKFFFSTWPSSFKNFRLYIAKNFLRFYPKNMIFDAIKEGLQERYGIQIEDHPDLIWEEFLQNMKNVEQRESLTDILIKANPENYTFPQYYRTAKSIPILKAKINLADGVVKRDNLIRALLNTCAVNNDLNALLDVLAYFLRRHRNDDSMIRDTFLFHFRDQFAGLDLREEHWEYIMNLVRWSILQNDCARCGSIIAYYIKYLFRKHTLMTDIRPYIVEFNKDLRKDDDWGMTFKDYPELRLETLLCGIESIAGMAELERRHPAFDLFRAIIQWNKEYPDRQINLEEHEVLLDAIKFKDGDSFIALDLMMRILKGTLQVPQRMIDDVQTSHWENFNEIFNEKLVEYYLRRKPLELVQNWTTFINVIAKKYLEETLCIWRLIKFYDHLELPSKVKTHIKSKEFDGFVRWTMGRAFGILSTGEEYFELLPVPAEEKVDVQNSSQKSDYTFIQSMLEPAKHLDDPGVLPKVVEFCKGDYLRYALAPLYYYFYHSAEKKLPRHLETLSKRAVSVRKHAIKLACSVSPIEIVYKLIKNVTETEKNLSALEHLHKKTFKYFLIDQKEEFWLLLQQQLKALHIQESESFNNVCNLRTIPEKFRMSHMTYVWNILEEMEAKGEDVSKYKEKIIGSLSPELLAQLSYDFCSGIIKHKFLKFDDKNHKIYNTFTIECTMYASNKELLVKDIFDVITKFRNDYILNPDIKITLRSRSYIDRFISDFYYEYSNDKNSSFDIISLFYMNWKNIFNPAENINNFIRLNLLFELKLITDVEIYVKKISELFDSFVQEYGVLGIIDCFKTALDYTLPEHVFGTNNEILKKCTLSFKLVVLPNSSISTMLLAINMLPPEIPENAEAAKLFSDCLAALKNVENNSVKIALDFFFNSLN